MTPTTTTHLLPVLFGRDGEFEGAPNWTCLIHGSVGGDPPTFFRIGTIVSGAFFAAGVDRRFNARISAPTLNLRIPSVAARVAGLCARALGNQEVASWCAIEDHFSWTLHGALAISRGSFGRTIELSWERSSGRAQGYGPGGEADHPSIPTLTQATDVASFLASLFLALAPRIAALGGSNVR